MAPAKVHMGEMSVPLAPALLLHCCPSNDDDDEHKHDDDDTLLQCCPLTKHKMMTMICDIGIELITDDNFVNSAAIAE